MQREPFPHILWVQNNINSPYFPKREFTDIVTPKLQVGDTVTIEIKMGGEYKYLEYKVSEIIEEYKAKGNWTNWGVHPNFYKVLLTL